MGKGKIRKQVDTFLNRVKKFKPEKVILCGSYAQNRANKYSDVDIIVISEKFKYMSEKKRFDELYSLTTDLHPDFQVHGYTPIEIRKMSKLTTLYYALQHGIVL